MNVNFGSLRFGYDIVPSRRQNRALKCIERELYPSSDDVSNTQTNNNCRNVTNLLEDNKNADIFVHLNNNGIIDVYVEKNLVSENGKKTYIPYSNIDNCQLKMSISGDMRKGIVLKKIREFADKCYWYATGTESRKNRLIEQSIKL